MKKNSKKNYLLKIKYIKKKIYIPNMSLDNKIKYDIFNFLDEHHVEKGKKYTHTSMGKPTGSFYIKEEELDTFYSLYEKLTFRHFAIRRTDELI